LDVVRIESDGVQQALINNYSPGSYGRAENLDLFGKLGKLNVEKGHLEEVNASLSDRLSQLRREMLKRGVDKDLIREMGDKF
jgi:hypothetical protein